MDWCMAAQEVDERETRKWKMCVSRADTQTRGKHNYTGKGGRGRNGMEHLFEMSLDRLMTVLPDVVT